MADDAVKAKYGALIDRDSAHELLTAKMNAAAAAKADAEFARQRAAIEKQRAKEQMAAQAECDRIMKRTSGTSRSSGSSSRSCSGSRSAGGGSMLEQVLGSKATRDVLTPVVEGIVGTRRST